MQRYLSTVPLRLFFGSAYMDLLGAPLSFLCAVHCFSLPFLAFLLPVSSLSIFASPELGWGLAFSSLLLGLYSLLHGYFHHHANKSIILVFFLGFGLVLSTKFVSGHYYHWLDWLAACGGICLSYAHLQNWRYSRRQNIRCSCSL